MGRSGVAQSLHRIKAQELVPGSTDVAIKGNNPEDMIGSSQTWNNFGVESRESQARRRGCGASFSIIWRQK